jgi:hypothetical protein
MEAACQAEAAGFDLTLIDGNLRCSYEQRALQHQQALSLALELERAGRDLRERTQLQPARLSLSLPDSADSPGT